MSEIHLRYKNQTPKERDWTIHIIAGWKLVKGVVLIVIAVKLLTLLNRDVQEWALDFVNRHGIDAENRFVHSILEKLAGVSRNQLMAMSGGAFLYSGLRISIFGFAADRRHRFMVRKALGGISDRDRDRRARPARSLRAFRAFYVGPRRRSDRQSLRRLVSRDAA
jgi:hypothetical protein